jgi:WD40 repeat protein
VWDISGKLIATLTGHQSEVNSASFSPDGKRIVTASIDNTAKVWDISGKLIATLTGHQELVNSASFSPDGKRIVTASLTIPPRCGTYRANSSPPLPGIKKCQQRQF